MSERRFPFAPGSVSLRLYPHLELPPTRIVEELIDQARLAVHAGFDGIMLSEHHNGFAGYLPNPVQAAGWVLEATDIGWGAPCPLLLPLRPAALVAEELAWMAARFPGRVGAGVAAGSLEQDFTVMGSSTAQLTARFADALSTVSDILLGRDPGVLDRDPAVLRCREDPVPLVSAAMSATAVRRAAACGVGLVFDSLTEAARCRALVDGYEAAGGVGPVVLVRRVWLGEPPVALQQRQHDVYRSYAPSSAVAHWGTEQLAAGDDADEVAARVLDHAEAVGADSVNLRVHVPGLDPSAARDQIERVAPVVDAMRTRWSRSGPAKKRSAATWHDVGTGRSDTRT